MNDPNKKNKKITVSFRVSPEVKMYLARQLNQADMVEKAIRESKGFKAWKAKQVRS